MKMALVCRFDYCVQFDLEYRFDYCIKFDTVNIGLLELEDILEKYRDNLVCPPF